jgi:hypothetical protein
MEDFLARVHTERAATGATPLTPLFVAQAVAFAFADRVPVHEASHLNAFLFSAEALRESQSGAERVVWRSCRQERISPAAASSWLMRCCAAPNGKLAAPRPCLPFFSLSYRTPAVEPCAAQPLRFFLLLDALPAPASLAVLSWRGLHPPMPYHQGRQTR